MGIRTHIAVMSIVAGAVGCDQPVVTEADAGPDTLPCDVRSLVESRCATCHASTPNSEAPYPLLTRADFLRQVGGGTVAQRSLERMNDTARPMPPPSEPPLDPMDIAMFDAWVAAGAPAGECGAIPPRPAATRCTSGQLWTDSEGNTAQMAPGQACRQCHLLLAPQRAYFFMGTVFPSFHEEDDCAAPPPEDGVIEILDASGAVKLVISPNAVGNFISTSVAAPFPVPYTARVRANGRVRAMTTPQRSGDCNACHTEQGSSNAPGRIVWP